MNQNAAQFRAAFLFELECRVGKGALAPCPPFCCVNVAGMVGTLRFAHPRSQNAAQFRAAFHFQASGSYQRSTNMTRDRHPMPDDVAEALTTARVRPQYDARPNYQRNDYIGWIDRARTVQTRKKRIAQMLDELRRGGIYMKMRHPASAPKR
jgi:bacteriocin resistance YdeI/OmpD-like protein